MNRIRMARLDDAHKINAIYETYLLNTAVTFEYDPVTDKEFIERMKKIQSKLPYLVCEVDGEIAGYAYLAPFKERAAFGWDLESTVYVKEGFYRRNIASALYCALIELALEMNYVNIYALITEPNERSKRMHESFGFVQVGLYPASGYKLGRWWGLNVMCRKINVCQIPPNPVKQISCINNQKIDDILQRACSRIMC